MHAASWLMTFYSVGSIRWFIQTDFIVHLSFTCIAQVNCPSTVVRPWELSPVISTHQRAPVASFCNLVPTATDSVQSGRSTDHTDSGYFSKTSDPVTSRRTLVCSVHLLPVASFVITKSTRAKNSLSGAIHWRGCAIGRASDLQFTGRGFESWPGTTALWPWANYLHL